MSESTPSGFLPQVLSGPCPFDLGALACAPEELYGRLDPACHEAILLSGGDHPLSNTSYVGLDPFLVVTSKAREVTLTRLPLTSSCVVEGDPFQVLQNILDRYRQTPPPGFPLFWGGGIGYFSYELGRYLETLPCRASDDLELPELYFVFYRSVLAFSHSNRHYSLYVTLLTDDALSTAYSMEATRNRILRAAKRPPGQPAGRATSTRPLSLRSNFTRDQYLEAVDRARHYIVEGDIYQVNLSQRFHTAYNGDSYGLFRRLFQINPAPFFAYLNAGPFQIVSSSPERFLLLKDGEIETRPIKGTLPRGRSPGEDTRNARALMQSEKNRAELAMITDLLRNDLGRVSEYGSVRVRDEALLEHYTNVFHLVSIVTGTLGPAKRCMDLLRATFPGGSITGCPKIRSMEIIDELENKVRSVYTGSIGYLAWDGNMDLNIAIRSIIRKGEDLYFQVGGGIVYDSDPVKEYEETLHKAASIKEALEQTTSSWTGPS